MVKLQTSAHFFSLCSLVACRTPASSLNHLRLPRYFRTQTEISTSLVDTSVLLHVLEVNTCHLNILPISGFYFSEFSNGDRVYNLYFLRFPQTGGTLGSWEQSQHLFSASDVNKIAANIHFLRSSC